MDAFSVFAALLLTVVYSWTLYNLPVLVVGVRRHCQEKKRPREPKKTTSEKELPSFSVVIPAKNEAAVLPRLLNALLHQNYPQEKFEVIVAEDGSADTTVGICGEYAEKSQGRIRIVHTEDSRGKPSALNHALKTCKGDIVAVFDADSIPEQDMLSNAAKHFQDESVIALQGRTLTVNSDTNMLTKFVSYEESAWYEAYMTGKEALNLFVHLKGSCQFIRRATLESIGGWSEEHLSEDTEMSARLTEKGYRIKYASDVRSWQETPESLSQMFGQRVRWFRGSMEVALNYGRLIKRPSFKTLDAEMTLFGPFVLIMSLMGYLLSPLMFASLNGSVMLIVSLAGWFVLTASLVVGAMTLLYIAKPKRKRDMLWLPFLYAYWLFQVFLATWALIKILCQAPREWKKTTKTGSVAMTDASVKAQIVCQNSPTRREQTLGLEK
jgi:cellulose synthase/poly-beta-1,6-N-acetylglucosamine synthase-like glycosyltransferase